MGYKETTVLCVDRGAHIFLGNNIAIAKGSVIRVISGGQLKIGDDFKGNFSTQIMCRKEMVFGRDCLIGWNCTFTDGDGHSLLCNGHRTNPDEAVYIGNHVWFGAHSTVLKGTAIRDGSVIAFGSLCNKKYDEKNILLAGNPAKIMKNGISWQI